MNSSAPLGVFDSGVGGLSVVKHLRQQLPFENLIYVADQKHLPYGPRPPAEIRQLCAATTAHLLSCDAKLIVVACNTASAAALSYLRARFPAIPFVGMEPAVKPAAIHTRNGRIGVLATAGTFESQRYESLLERFGRDVRVVENHCPGLVEQIEAGALESPRTAEILQDALNPMLDAGVDTVVLGCTHYPFVLPLIAKLVGDRARIIDPAPAVARQAQRVLDLNGSAARSSYTGRVSAYTTGNAALFTNVGSRLLGEAITARALDLPPDAAVAA